MEEEMKYLTITLLIFISLFIACIEDPPGMKDDDGDNGSSGQQNDPTDQPGFPQPGEMVLIPAGTFKMGIEGANSNERPVHEVYLDAYYIGIFEVTNAEYAKFVEATGRYSPSTFFDVNFNGPNQPVGDVSWEDADEYCKWVGKRLPTEAEWEKAARGTDERMYPWGNASLDHIRANYRRNVKHTTPVGSYPEGVSPYGLYDMCGNVWEWVADYWAKKYYEYSPRENPKGPESVNAHVIRGGSWANNTGYISATVRPDPNFEHRQGHKGFRCVEDAP